MHEDPSRGGGGLDVQPSRFKLVAYTSPASLFRYTLGDNLPLFASRVGWIIRRAENGLSKSVKDCFQKRTTLYFDVVCVCVCVHSGERGNTLNSSG